MDLAGRRRAGPERHGAAAARAGGEPAKKPASIPSISKIELERKREVGAQVRAAVENVLTKGGAVSATQLGKWERDGTEYFFRVLRRRIVEEMSASKPAGAVPPAKSAKARRGNAKATRATKRSEASKATVATLPVSTDRDWTDQQRNRWSTRTRAIVHGLIVTAILFVGVVAFTRLWSGLAPRIQQQIQNWR